jgi:hypothetical protein
VARAFGGSETEARALKQRLVELRHRLGAAGA